MQARIQFEKEDVLRAVEEWVKKNLILPEGHNVMSVKFVGEEVEVITGRQGDKF